MYVFYTNLTPNLNRVMLFGFQSFRQMNLLALVIVNMHDGLVGWPLAHGKVVAGSVGYVQVVHDPEGDERFRFYLLMLFHGAVGFEH